MTPGKNLNIVPPPYVFPFDGHLPVKNSPRLSQRAHVAGPQPISELMRLALVRPELISLAAGFVDQQSLPVSETLDSAKHLLGEELQARAALQYGTNAGHVPLRQAVLDRFIAAEGPSATPPPTVDQVLLTAGSNQLLHLVCEALLDPGDIVLCAAPTYFVFLGMLAGMGARSVGVAADNDGMIPAALEAQLTRLRAAGELPQVKAIYLVSYFENPSGVTLSRERRAEIINVAERWSHDAPLYVIDDSAYRLLRYEGDDLPSLRSFDRTGERVIVAETFSKPFSPGIRVGWGILPHSLLGPVAGLKANIDFGSPHFNQVLMSEVLARGCFEPHVEKLRATYRTKLAAMLAALSEHLADISGVRWQAPEGGLYVWLTLPEGMDAGPGSRLLQKALDEGVLYVPGEHCYPAEGEPVRKNRIRLSFGVQNPHNIGLGVAALARAIRHCG